jgi:hypothetical protein
VRIVLRRCALDGSAVGALQLHAAAVLGEAGLVTAADAPVTRTHHDTTLITTTGDETADDVLLAHGLLLAEGALTRADVPVKR